MSWHRCWVCSLRSEDSRPMERQPSMGSHLRRHEMCVCVCVCVCVGQRISCGTCTNGNASSVCERRHQCLDSMNIVSIAEIHRKRKRTCEAKHIPL